MLVVVWFGLAATTCGLQAAGQAGSDLGSPEAHSALLTRYCLTCHNAALAERGTVPVSFEHLDLANVGADGAQWETVVRKMRAGVMPPPGRPRPNRSASSSFVGWVEESLDAIASERPNPGRTESFHRLNRAEYRNAVRDLLHLDVDVSALLPADDASYGFDNIAGVLRFSPTLMERYLNAAKKVSRAAVGLPPPFPHFDVFRLPDDLPQDDWFADLPFGTRGGTRIPYNFPADGDYTIRVKLARQVGTYDRNVPNFHQPQQLEISIDGERLEAFTLEPSVPQELQSRSERRANRARLDEDWMVRFSTSAGPREVMVTFLNRTPALLETLIEPYQRPHPSGGHNWGSRRGVYLRSVEISGPLSPDDGFGLEASPAARLADGSDDTPSRRRIFVCRAVLRAQERECADTILGTLARRAYRRPVEEEDVAALRRFYEAGRVDGGFESGIEMAVRRLLVSPEFLFRTEADPADVVPGTNYLISDLELASRLAFFLWSSIPDDSLLELAERGELGNPVVLEQQVRRMLLDPRSQAIVDNFVGQWLLLRNVAALGPDPYKDPDFDESLRKALRRETELLFESIIQEDRSVVDLLEADYTFVNERLAEHYDIPFVKGDHFRRVALLPGSVRGGLLGQGSILSVTSQPDRTSPVLRGKWILENILGVSPPAPPPDVPDLAEQEGVATAVTMREQMEAHRANPVCASCHRMMDPLGLALEHFDQAGRWRTVEESFDSRSASFAPIDASGAMPDGTQFVGADGLRKVLLDRSDRFVATMIEKLLTYALGRGLEPYDMPAVRAVAREAASDGHRLSSIIVGVVRSIPFQMRRSES